MVADDWDGRILNGGKVKGDEVAWQEIEDLYAFARRE
jgi:hypothetical protein